MVMAPEKPPHTRAGGVAPMWRWLAVGFVVALAAIGVLWLVTSGDEPADVGPGPVGPVGPAGPVGPSDGVGDGTVEGSGTIITEARDVTGFTSVVLAGEGTVSVSAGSAAVTVRTDDNLVPLIVTEVRNGVLFLDTSPDVYDIDPTDGVFYDVALPGLAGLEIAGAGTIVLDGFVGDTMELAISGSGTIEASAVDVAALRVEGTGAGAIRVSGVAVTQDVTLGGTVAYLAQDLRTGSATIAQGSSSTATVWVTDDLAVSSTGIGAVDYYGSPAIAGDSGAILRSLGDK